MFYCSQGKYISQKGRVHRFQVRPNCSVVKHYKLLQQFFGKVPVFQRGQCVWEICIVKSYKYCKPGLHPGRWYNIKIGPMTAGSSKCRPALYFFADRITRSTRRCP